MMRSTLYKTNTLNWFFIVLAHWKKKPNSLQINKSLHSDTLSWFRANQFLLLLLNAACLSEKQNTNTNFKVFGLIWLELEPMIYCTQDKHVNHYTTDAVYNFWKKLDRHFLIRKEKKRFMSMFMLSFIFVIVCGLLKWKRICMVFFYHLLISVLLLGI